MNVTKIFNKIVDESVKNKQYVGIGNPNAKILIVGKEAGVHVGTDLMHGSAISWKDKNRYAERYTPEVDTNLRNYNHTWQKYQKLYGLIEAKLGMKPSKNEDYEITFVENVFTTELSNLGAPTTREAKKIDGFKEALSKRKEEFWKSDFVRSFPIVIITASDNQYIETYQGEVCELFDVEFVEKINCKSDKIWVHNSSKNPKLVLHTRQLTNSASSELFEKIAELISDFVKKHTIEIIVKQPFETASQHSM